MSCRRSTNNNNEALTAALTPLGQGQATAPARTDQQQAALDRVSLSVATATANGRIPGYSDERRLTTEEDDLLTAYTRMGASIESAHEIFRAGLNSIQLLEDLGNEAIGKLVLDINKFQSPKCPDKTAVYLGPRFTANLDIFMSWIKFQPIIGLKPTAAAWLEDSSASRNTVERLKMEKMMKAAEKSYDVAIPKGLTHMNKFLDFELRLRDYLKSRVGSAGTSLLYVIRMKEDTDVGDEQRNGTVGGDPTDKYSDWIDYTIRCTVHSGRHFLCDDARVWSILYSLVAPGPGWDYIKHHVNKDGAKGNGRAAFLELRQQAYNTTNIEQIVENELRFMRESNYDATKSSNSYTFEEHKRKWFSCMNTLLKYNELPRMDRFIKDFLRSIKCPIIDPMKSDLCEPGSKYLENFSVMTAKLSHIIGLNRSINTATNNNGNRNNHRVSSASTNGSRKRKSQDGGGTNVIHS